MRLLREHRITTSDGRKLPERYPATPPLVAYCQYRSPRKHNYLLTSHTHRVSGLRTVCVSTLLTISGIHQHGTKIRRFLSLILGNISSLDVRVTHSINGLLRTITRLKYTTNGHAYAQKRGVRTTDGTDDAYLRLHHAIIRL